MSILLRVSIMLTLLLGACQSVTPPTKTLSPPTPPPTESIPTLPQGISILIDPADVRQSIRHVGSGNFVHKLFGITQAFDPIARMNVDVFNPQVARLRLTLEDWEPVNDNDDPLNSNPAGFKDDGFNRATFEAMQTLQSNGATLIATMWDVPDWLVLNPNAEKSRLIPFDRYDELIESVTAWLIHAKDVYGVDVAYVSFNEPNYGVNVSWSASEMVGLLRRAGPRFAELGLQTRWLLADTANMQTAMSYARIIWKNEDVRPYLGPLSFHSWDADSPDARLESVATFAAENGIEAWCTEAGYDPFLWQKPKIFTTWNNAIQLGTIYTRLLKLSGANSLLYWEMMAQDYQINDGAEPYPAMLVLQALDKSIPPGSNILGSSQNISNTFHVAAQTPKGFTLAIVNAEAEAQNISVSGLPAGNYLIHVVSEAAPADQQKNIDGQYQLTLPAASLTVIELAP